MAKLPLADLRRMMADPDVPEKTLRQYLRPAEDGGGVFNPEVVPNPETVEITEDELALESAIGFGNQFCRFRRKKAFERRIARGDPAPVLVAEGDSWFQFPFLVEDVIDHLSRDFNVWCISAAGDTAQNIVHRNPEYMRALDAQAGRAQAFLFSAAGNDVIGEDETGAPVLNRLLRQNPGSGPVEDLIDRAALDKTLGFLRDSYRTVIDTIRADARFSMLPIIVHGYDYAFPGAPGDERDPIYAKPDEWLGGPLRARGITHPSTQRAVVGYLIDALYAMLFALAGDSAKTGVHVVDVRKTLWRKTDWADEIHGTDDGFGLVAEKFRAVIDAAIGRRAPVAFERGTEGRGATIVLDPGHGGAEDVGGSSANNIEGSGGVQEKTVALALARAAKAALEARGHRVLLTRASDRNLGLASRAAVAREAQAAAFVSLHFSADQPPQAFHHPDAGRDAERLARAVQAALEQATGLKGGGVRALRLGVLTPERLDARTAACLVEVSGLADPAEAARLADPAYLRRLAAALADGIERHLAGDVARGVESAQAAAPDYEDAASAPPPPSERRTLADGRQVRGAVSPGLARAFDKRAFERGDGASEMASPMAGFSDVEKFLDAWRARSRSRAGLSPSGKFERTVGRNDALPFFFLHNGHARGRAVCKIEASGVDFQGGEGAWFGSGFLVGPNLLLSNNHVLNSAAVAREAWAKFSFERTPGGGLSPVRAFRMDPDRLFITSPAVGGLDYTFVWLDGDAHEEFGFIPMERGAFTIAPHERANVIHHPKGEPKQVSLQNNELIDFHPVMLHYVSDTEGGSSGSPVMDNTWRLIALHHAWEALPPGTPSPGREGADFVNEGVKIAAIVVDLETRLTEPSEAAAAQAVLAQVGGADSITGYFGAVGRRARAGGDAYERVVDVYQGSGQDVDIAFWNVEWFNRRFTERVGDVARVIADLNVDIWALSESSPEATQALVTRLKDEFGHQMAFAASEPDAPGGRQTTTVLWNPLTVKGERRDWPPEIAALLRLDSRDPAAQPFEAVEGAIFNRFPGLFHFTALQRDEPYRAAFDFNLVPLHLKAMDEGRRRRRMASNILAQAVRLMIERHGADEDWVIGGDVNAELASEDFAGLTGRGFLAMSAQDEAEGAFSFLKRPRSLIDSIFLSPSLSRRYGADDFFIYARDAKAPDFVKTVSDHRPVLARLALRDAAPAAAAVLPAVVTPPAAPPAAEADALDQTLALLRADPDAFLRALAARLKALDE